MSIIPRDLLRKLLKENKVKDAKDIQEVLKKLFGDALAEMLEAELDSELGYSKYDYKNKETTNSRNGHSKKTLRSDYGKLDIDVPRDREGDFEPGIVKKYQNDVSSIDDQVLSMYARGMTTRDIEAHLENIYGVDASPELISKITDKITPLVTEWQNRPLASLYAILFMDAIHYKVRSEGRVITKAAYTAIGVDLEGVKDVLGIWVGENESAKFWLSVINEIKNRGVKDILIVSVDNLSGFSDAIKAVFPETEIQKCILHQIRNSTRFISYKDIKAFTADLKKIYKAATEEAAISALDKLEERWAKKYPLAIKSWRTNWAELSTYLKYPEELRRIIYTTNTVENYHRALRKVTKAKAVFPNDQSLMKILYLATMDTTKRWKDRMRDWPLIISQLEIYFGERVTQYVVCNTPVFFNEFFMQIFNQGI
ncbi:MAG: transposase [Actinobacteria bacterium RBG_19FT_COMBO_36_27]|nr:MAG: transposase [Actinobacteria bacterium RBG_19FT_COMBO_36_27]